MRLINFLKSKFKKSLFYVVEDADWVIKREGKYITKNLNKLNLINALTTAKYQKIKNQIIHFGSINTLLTKDGLRCFNRSNKTVTTWYHVVPGDKKIKYIPALNKEIDIIHTSCHLTKNKLVNYGLKEEKIRIVPLGVDLNLFKSASKDVKEKIRKELKIPKESICIGSFQKDGVGWEDGNEPKLVKGPDIFCDVVAKLSKKYPIHVLLIGPARGYVKKRLKKAGIPFYHQYLRNFQDIAKYYHALDFYLITSREEGGPKAILEAMASGVPLISTKVGMALDVIKNGENGFLVKVEDVNNLVKYAEKIITMEKIKRVFIKNGFKTIKNYSWETIAKQYYEKIYSKLLERK